MSARRGPNSFPKNLRLLRRSEFRGVYEGGQRRSAPLCTLFFRSNGRSRSRLGITVPVSVGNAVVRNRVKRRVREVFRLNRGTIPGGWDIVVNPRRIATTAPFATLARELTEMFPRTAPAGLPGAARES